jgi:hypothetical protein
MTTLALFVVLLAVAAIVLCLVQAAGWSLDRVSPGWLGLALGILAALLANLP